MLTMFVPQFQCTKSSIHVCGGEKLVTDPLEEFWIDVCFVLFFCNFLHVLHFLCVFSHTCTVNRHKCD